MQAGGHSRNSAAVQQNSGAEPEQAGPSQLPSLSQITQSHYELEFENPSSTWARKLFADAERTSLEMADDLENARNGRSGCLRSKARSTSHNTRAVSLSSHSQASQQQRPSTSSTPSSPHHSPSPSRLSRLGAYTSRPIQTSPEREKRKSREEVVLLHRVPEDGAAMEFHSAPISQSFSSRNANDQTGDGYDRSSQTTTPVIGTAPRYLGGQPLTMDDDDEEEEEQWILDEELARQGLYRGSYRQLVSLYSLTPVFTFLAFLFLAYLPKIAYPTIDATPGAPYPYSPFLPFPLPEILTPIAFWALSYLLSSFIFSLFSFVFPNSSRLSLLLGSLFQSSLGLILREAVVPILLVPRSAVFDHPTWRDISFLRTWWVALGWAAAEAVVGLKQGYDGIALYRDVLVSVRRIISSPKRSQKQKNVQMPGELVDVERRPLLERRSSVASSTATQSDANLKNSIEEEVERDVDELIALRGREELEDLYGMPFIHIPVFISCLHRLNSVLFVLGSTLLLTAAYMRSSLSLDPPNSTADRLGASFVDAFHRHSSRSHGDIQFFITFPLLVVLQWVLSLLHTPQVLPRIGVQTFVYIGFMISLGVFFAGLGVWEGII
ncbi:hypothetical protein D9756_008043 [Leucocoprinus leucothites]|uniref:Uncharacterized protein n=1 Tax=Leucocoprinus leucothites TaxID=201217 RepID=A0A8H5D4C2_9AGAR|nr:hypothetical protein D9756_008043 [Leucoagaricus leucothites]